jgi:energy-converting hydrogenase Eha subunit A
MAGSSENKINDKRKVFHFIITSGPIIAVTITLIFFSAMAPNAFLALVKRTPIIQKDCPLRIICPFRVDTPI